MPGFHLIARAGRLQRVTGYRVPLEHNAFGAYVRKQNRHLLACSELQEHVARVRMVFHPMDRAFVGRPLERSILLAMEGYVGHVNRG